MLAFWVGFVVEAAAKHTFPAILVRPGDALIPLLPKTPRQHEVAVALLVEAAGLVTLWGAGVNDESGILFFFKVAKE